MRTILALLLVASPALAGEIVRVSAETWDRVPGGKEVDAIYGDYLMRNDKVVAVVGDAAPRRHANMSVRHVQGALIDFALLSANNDQLSAFFPHGDRAGKGAHATRIEVVQASGPEVVLRAIHEPSEKDPLDQVTEYSLRDGDSFLRVTTRHRNAGEKSVKVRLSDKMRCDQTFAQTPAGETEAVVFYDPWFHAAYGVVRADGKIATDGKYGGMFAANAGTWLDYPELVKDAKEKTLELAPGQEARLTRFVVAGRHAADVQAVANGLLRKACGTVTVTVTDPDGAPIAGADVLARREGHDVSAALTDETGKATFSLPPAKYAVTARQIGRSSKVGAAEISSSRPLSLGLSLGALSRIRFEVTDGLGLASPCKAQFIGVESTPPPDLGPKQRANGCGNLYFSPNGKFEVPLPPGKYYVILSRGPEFDAVYRYVSLTEGKTVPIAARLVRSVNSAGWVSADFHNHSTESGDNTTETAGRVTCLAAEGVEFIAATEHNRILSYRPWIKSLGLEKVLATSDGIELTASPLPLSHHNAFPLHLHPHVQDNGGPEIGPDPLAQIQRLYHWDNDAEKLVQQNHPDIGWLFYDKDGDGKPDEGFGTAEFTHVMEVWRPTILDLKPIEAFGVQLRNNRAFNWLQLLNQGIRIPGTANTDAHYCIHESGKLRNYVKCSTDDPAKIDEMEIVRESKKGHLVMTNGPFLDVSLNGALPGDDLKLTGKAVLHVRVECPNWLDIDRVQVLVNGRPEPSLNFTREMYRRGFGDGPVKFQGDIDLVLEKDAHIIVIAIGEHSMIGPVMGQSNEPPLAVSNPIFVDVDGNGFVPNKDTLGSPLPVRKDRDER